MTNSAIAARWEGDLKLLGDRVSGVLLDDQVAWTLRAIIRQNDGLRGDSSLLLDMIWFGYVHRTAIRLRAMADTHRNSVSFVNLLADIEVNHSELSSFAQAYSIPSVHDLQRWRGEFTTAVDPVRRYVNKEVAHWDRGGHPDELLYTQLRRAVHEAARLNQRLHMCFTGGHLYPTPQVAESWTGVLRYPWWPEGTNPRAIEAAVIESDLSSLAIAERWPTSYWP